MNKRSTLLYMMIIVICILLLFALMLAVVMMTGVTSGTLHGQTPFSLSSLTSGETNTSSCADAIQPAFIGIVTHGEKQGIAAGDSVIDELYAFLAPWIADALAAEPYPASNGPETDDEMIIVEYHEALPAVLIGACASALSGYSTDDTAFTDLSLLNAVQRLFLQITPGGKYTILTQDADGGWLCYTCPEEMGEVYPAVQKWQEWETSFRNHFYRFSFVAEHYYMEAPEDNDAYSDPWEVVFLERIRTRGMIVADETGGMLRNRQDHTDTFVRMLNYNPDKLSSREEKDGSLTLVENHGILRLTATEFRYSANAEGGVELNHIIGYRESYTAIDMLRAAWTVIENLRNMQPYCTGADAEITLTAVERATDGIRFTFSYTFDNLLLWNTAPAMTFTVSEDYRVTSVQISTIAVRSIGEYSTMYVESGVRPALGDGATILVYDTECGEALFPQWLCLPEGDA